MKTAEELNKLSEAIIGAAIEVHRELGPGVLERIYEDSLQKELRNRGFASIRQLPQPVSYKGELLDEEGYRLDLLVEDSVVVELKTVARLEPIHSAQPLSYLRLSDKRLGLLINFHTPTLTHGLKRLVHNFPAG